MKKDVGMTGNLCSLMIGGYTQMEGGIYSDGGRNGESLMGGYTQMEEKRRELYYSADR